MEQSGGNYFGVIVMLFLFGVYGIITGILIHFKNKKILTVDDYIKMFFMDRKRAKEYKKATIESVNWSQQGILTAIYGILIIFISIFLRFVLDN